jgi:hypothetical protein
MQHLWHGLRRQGKLGGGVCETSDKALDLNLLRSAIQEILAGRKDA